MTTINDRIIIQEKVMSLLGWTIEDYTWFQYESGLKYLEYYLVNDIEGQQLLQSKRLFWAWWKLRWINRDIVFVGTAEKCTQNLCRELYDCLHDPQELIHEMKPPRLVTKYAFA